MPMLTSGAVAPPPTFVASASDNSGSSSPVVNKPTGTASGDLMIAVISAATNSTSGPTCSGWTQLAWSGSGGLVSYAILYKVAGGSEPSSYTFSCPWTAYASIVTYRNAAIGLRSPNVYYLPSASVVTLPEMSIPVTNSILFALYCVGDSSAPTTPGGMSSVVSYTGGSAGYNLFSESRSSGLTGTRASTTGAHGIGMSFFIVPAGYSAPSITFVASATSAVLGSSLTVSKPAGVVQNDLLIAFMGADTTGTSYTWTGDTGWTEIADQGSGGALRIAYKVAASSEPSTYTFTASGGGATLRGAILAYRGAAYDAIGSISSTVSQATGPVVSYNYSKAIMFATQGDSTTYTHPGNVPAGPDMTTRVSSFATTPTNIVMDETVAYGPTFTRYQGGYTSAGFEGAVVLTIKPA